MDVLVDLKNRRKYLGISQVDLAQMSGVSLATVKDIERGQGNPSLETLLRLCDVLGLEIVCKVTKMML